MNVNFKRVPVGTLSAFLIAAASYPHSDEEAIAKFAGGFSKATAKKVLPTLVELGLIRREESGKFICDSPAVRRGMSDESVRLVLKNAFLNYRPFETFTEGVSLGESEDEARRRALLILNSTDESGLGVLIGWAEDLGIISREGGRISLAPDLQATAAAKFNAIAVVDATSEAAVRLYNAARLGRDANNFLDEVDRSLLAKAQMNCTVDPEDAVEKAGQALEDFLRELAKAKGLDAEAKACNGAGQVASMLVGKSVIHSHHSHLVLAISAVRNMKAHHKDKKTLMPWHVSPAGACWSVLGTLTLISSIHGFVFGGSQTL